jgi:hypothetical protein
MDDKTAFASLPPKDSQVPLSITREQLYELVWSKSMLQVAAYFEISSSYLARVCNELRIPRPPRGHWIKLEFGKVSPRQPLPASRSGEMTVWNRGKLLSSPQPNMTRSAERVPKVARPLRKPRSDAVHDLILAAKPFFLKVRSKNNGLLRPTKKLLVDIVVSESLLDDALATANALFQEFSAHEHRVLLSPLRRDMRRAEVDVREASGKNDHCSAAWSPDRPTVVYIGSVAIGLTLFEMTEATEVVYVNGDYLPRRTMTPVQLPRYKEPRYWSTTKDVTSGRLCLQAYCPDWKVKWSRQWRETKPQQLRLQIKQIVRELEASAPALARQVEDAELRAQAQRLAREAMWERQRIEAERARKAKVRAESRSDLLGVIAKWDEIRRIHEFFSAAHPALQSLDESERAAMSERLERARELIGKLEPLSALRNWKTPEER